VRVGPARRARQLRQAVVRARRDPGAPKPSPAGSLQKWGCRNDEPSNLLLAPQDQPPARVPGARASLHARSTRARVGTPPRRWLRRCCRTPRCAPAWKPARRWGASRSRRRSLVRHRFCFFFFLNILELGALQHPRTAGPQLGAHTARSCRDVWQRALQASWRSCARRQRPTSPASASAWTAATPCAGGGEARAGCNRERCPLHALMLAGYNKER
jgi:hypothetical protein